MSAPDVMVHSIRVGVFSTIQPADRAVARLLEAGFTPDQLTVVCSGEVQENYFRDLGIAQGQQASGTEERSNNGEITTGATVGAAVGSLSAIALGVATGAVPLAVAGMTAAAGGGALGGFLGIMTSKEVKNDFLNACHEQVLAGKILVSVTDDGHDSAARLATAERILTEEGSETNALPQP